ncbi:MULTISPECIES: hypothetical protein [unclassified Acinetobacter]|nr:MULTISPECIES: hypothetical protein [unclassified Acinetobacter]MBJ9955361.1 hypothetical protein [Acinetobacter baumannii]
MSKSLFKIIYCCLIFSGTHSFVYADDGIPIMASRANCKAITPEGVGYHNESFSWTLGFPKAMIVETLQTAANGATRSKASSTVTDFPNPDMEYGYRAYAGYVDSFFKPNRNWSVKGKHTYEFSLGGNIGYRETLATDCNATQGWPW